MIWRRHGQQTLIRQECQVWRPPLCLLSSPWWNALPAMTALRGALAGAGLADRVDTLVGVEGARVRRDLTTLLITELFTPMVTTVRDFRFERAAFDAACRGLMDGLLQDRARLVEVVPLLGFEASSALDLSPRSTLQARADRRRSTSPWASTACSSPCPTATRDGRSPARPTPAMSSGAVWPSSTRSPKDTDTARADTTGPSGRNSPLDSSSSPTCGPRPDPGRCRRPRLIDCSIQNCYRSGMARPREFDADQAIGRAMDLFWRRGYAATSLQDLTAELGIGSGSLYGAFGSKDGLYERALERYCSEQAGGLVRRLEQADEIRPALASLLAELVEADLSDPGRGCLLVSAATERSEDSATVERVGATFRRVESALAGALERAQARGEIGPDKQPARLARFLTTFIQGMRVMGQARADRGFLEDAVATALRSLD